MLFAPCLFKNEQTSPNKSNRLKGKEMLPGYVNTIREEILYGYAKLIWTCAYETLENGMCPHFNTKPNEEDGDLWQF